MRVLRWSLSLLALCPAIVTLFLVVRYGVDIPYADEWTFAPLLAKARDHTLGFSDFLAQHNEHRYVFPKLLFVVFSYIAPGNLRAEMVFSVILCALTSLNLWIILQRTLPQRIEKRLLLFTLLNLVLFSPVQAENWTWGFQFALFLNNFLLTTGIVVATSELPTPRKFWLCATIAFIASFSFGSGFVLWATTFPVALISRKDQVVNWKSPWLAAWGIAFIGTVAIYFTHYTKPAHHPPIAASTHILDYALYIATFLGAHLSQATRVESIALAATIGTFLLIAFAFALIFCLFHSDQRLLNRMAPWLAIGAFALVSAVLAALARIGFGVSQALDSRYTTFSLCLSIAVIGLVSIVHETSSSSLKTESGRLVFARVETAFLILFFLAIFTSAKWGIGSIKSIERTRLWGKASLLFGNVLDNGSVYGAHLGGWAPDVLKYANMENSISLLLPPLFQTSEISRLPTVPATKTVLGYVDNATCLDDQCEITGWAVLPKRRRVADCVAVAYENADGRRIIFGVSDQVSDRPDVAQSFHRKSLVRCGWAVHFRRSTLPSGAQRISAWAIDSKRGVLIEMNSTQVLP